MSQYGAKSEVILDMENLEHHKIFSNLVTRLQEDASIKPVVKRGLCRVWTKLALRVIEEFKQQNGLELQYDARETVLSGLKSHTFIRAVIGSDASSTAYILDGIGVEQHEPYFGPEDNSPDHLKNSKEDIINIYHKQYLEWLPRADSSAWRIITE